MHSEVMNYFFKCKEVLLQIHPGVEVIADINSFFLK